MPTEKITINESIDQNGVKTIEKIIERVTTYSPEQALRIKEYQRNNKDKIAEITKRYYEKRKARIHAEKQDAENALAKVEGREPVELIMKRRVRKPKSVGQDPAPVVTDTNTPVVEEVTEKVKPKKVKKVKIVEPKPEPEPTVELAPVPSKKVRKPKAKKNLPVA